MEKLDRFTTNGSITLRGTYKELGGERDCICSTGDVHSEVTDEVWSVEEDTS